MLGLMSSDSQYGAPRFIDDFNTGTSVKLIRLHFSSRGQENAPYDEAWLQRLIMKQPDLLPVYEIEPAFADLVPVCIELPTRSGGFVDNLLVTASGNLVLVEFKLWRNPEARREVVAQIIDYAKDLSAGSYEDLQAAIAHAKHPDGSDGKLTGSLYDIVSARSGINEVSFHDAVSRNLRLGRFLLLIVGDGIREGVSSMTEFLQQHAGLHFTLAIVELALFQVPTGGCIAQPRVLARTTLIERGVVRIEDERITIKPSREVPLASSFSPGAKATITKEIYLEKLDREIPNISEKLNRFTDKLATLGVRSDMGKDSMNLRWNPDDGRPWNLGTIVSVSGHAGELWMDYMGKRAETEGLLNAFHQCLKDIASQVPGAVLRQTLKPGSWVVAAKDGKVIRINELLADVSREEGWLRAIEQFLQAVAASQDS